MIGCPRLQQGMAGCSPPERSAAVRCLISLLDSVCFGGERLVNYGVVNWFEWCRWFDSRVTVFG